MRTLYLLVAIVLFSGMLNASRFRNMHDSNSSASSTASAYSSAYHDWSNTASTSGFTNKWISNAFDNVFANFNKISEEIHEAIQNNPATVLMNEAMAKTQAMTNTMNKWNKKGADADTILAEVSRLNNWEVPSAASQPAKTYSSSNAQAQSGAPAAETTTPAQPAAQPAPSVETKPVKGYSSTAAEAPAAPAAQAPAAQAPVAQAPASEQIKSCPYAQTATSTAAPAEGAAKPCGCPSKATTASQGASTPTGTSSGAAGAGTQGTSGTQGASGATGAGTQGTAGSQGTSAAQAPSTTTTNGQTGEIHTAQTLPVTGETQTLNTGEQLGGAQTSAQAQGQQVQTTHDIVVNPNSQSAGTTSQAASTNGSPAVASASSSVGF